MPYLIHTDNGSELYLMHAAGHKYIRKEMVNGRMQYYYDDGSTSASGVRGMFGKTQGTPSVLKFKNDSDKPGVMNKIASKVSSSGSKQPSVASSREKNIGSGKATPNVRGVAAVKSILGKTSQSTPAASTNSSSRAKPTVKVIGENDPKPKWLTDMEKAEAKKAKKKANAEAVQAKKDKAKKWLESKGNKLKSSVDEFVDKKITGKSYKEEMARLDTKIADNARRSEMHNKAGAKNAREYFRQQDRNEQNKYLTGRTKNILDSHNRLDSVYNRTDNKLQSQKWKAEGEYASTVAGKIDGAKKNLSKKAEAARAKTDKTKKWLESNGNKLKSSVNDFVDKNITGKAYKDERARLDAKIADNERRAAIKKKATDALLDKYVDQRDRNEQNKYLTDRAKTMVDNSMRLSSTYGKTDTKLEIKRHEMSNAKKKKK